ncbi:alpha/beta hydrolase [Streptomyces thermolineatus]|uniref:Alpha/beta hydrolase n=1 Tax=Streptomyces thermolineatus TaxID=44033 RepID=A0ABP5ZZJ1_9ACTN
MVRHIEVIGAQGTRLAAWDFTESTESTASAGPIASAGPTASAGPVPSPPGVLLLHGLLGRASTWAPAARFLAPHHRTVALDQRGHGDSDRPAEPSAYSLEAHVGDAEAALEQLGPGPAVLVGHGMGALTAWRLAARRPDLVRALVVCDTRAAALGGAAREEQRRWLDSWPLPFASPDAARRWFGEQDPSLERPCPARGDFHAELLERRPDGWWPGFSPDHVMATLDAWVYDAHWDDLAQVPCPALVVRGVDGQLGRAEAQEMVRVLPRGRYAEVPGAGPLLHYGQPDAWYAAVAPFLAEHSLPAPSH